MNEIKGDLNPPARLGNDLLLHQRNASVKGLSNNPPEQTVALKDVMDLRTQDGVAVLHQEALDRGTDQNRARVPCKQHDAVLQVTKYLSEVLLEGGEDLLDVAHPAAQPFDLVRHEHDSVRRRRRRLQLSGHLCTGQGIQAFANLYQRVQGKV